MSESLALGFDLRFADLHDREGLVRLDGCFVTFLAERDRELHARLMAARATPAAVAGKAESDLIVELARLAGGELTELGFAEHVDRWLKAEVENARPLELAARYAAWAVHTGEGQRRHKSGVLFKVPH